ncbi:MAG: radical SAM protein [candidate division Zixibacteria bacterium]|nr:radical SAM protein [candidate division Zixibacteria bacterium]
MSLSEYQYVYGPVPSRRLGHSLGIDLVPFKTCTYDCIYCQLGRTTNKTIERKAYVAASIITAEIKKKLAERPVLDYITLAGSGEPTLNTEIEQVIHNIKTLTSTPVAVLTNGSLLSEPQVRKALMAADLVIPSLDAGDKAMFQRVNRPQADISFEKMVRGIATFRENFVNGLWLEVFLIAKLTDSLEQVKKIAGLANDIQPDKVQINTVSRPPAEKYALPVSETNLLLFKELFRGETEIIPEQKNGLSNFTSLSEIDKNNLLSLLERRPCTALDVSEGLGINITEAVKQLNHLLKEGVITTRREGNRLFYERKRTP